MNGSIPFNATAQKSQPIKCFKHYTPLHADEALEFGKAVQELAKARKVERKLRSKSVLKFISPAKHKKAACTYLSSLPCLQANMVEANARRPYADRISLP